MDPNQAWMDMARAVRDDEWERAATLAEELLAWFKRDGFPPAITGIREFDIVAAKAICTTILFWEIA